MVFTSYYGQMRNFPASIIPIAISRGIPSFFNGTRLLDLAPPSYVLSRYKEEEKKNLGAEHMAKIEKWYDNEYHGHIVHLGKERAVGLIESASNEGGKIWESKESHIALLCYEKAGDFCHRSLLSDYLNEQGYPCREVTKDELLQMKKDLKAKEDAVNESIEMEN